MTRRFAYGGIRNATFGNYTLNPLCVFEPTTIDDWLYCHVLRRLLWLSQYLSYPSAAVCLVFIVTVSIGLKRGRLSQKLYVFLLSRALTDLSVPLWSITANLYVQAKFALYCTGYGNASQSKECQTVMRAHQAAYLLVSVAFFGSFYTNASLAVLKLLAVKRPLFYRRYVTRTHCLAVTLLYWLVVLVPQLILIVSLHVACDRWESASACAFGRWSHRFVSRRPYVFLGVYALNVLLALPLLFRSDDRADRRPSHHRCPSAATSSSLRRLRRRRTSVVVTQVAIRVNLCTFLVCYAPRALLRLPLWYTVDVQHGTTLAATFSIAHRLLFTAKELLEELRICVDSVLPFCTDDRLKEFARDLLRWPPWRADSNQLRNIQFTESVLVGNRRSILRINNGPTSSKRIATTFSSVCS